MHPKDADGMANSVAWSALFAETYLSQYIEFVRYSQNSFSLLCAQIFRTIFFRLVVCVFFSISMFLVDYAF